MDSRTVLAAVALCTGILPAALARGGHGERARQSTAPTSCPGTTPSAPLLEVINVPGEPDDEVVAAGTFYDPGTRYTVVVCGVITRKIPVPAGRTSVQDAFYRVSCTEASGQPCPGGTAPTASTHLMATDGRDRQRFERGGLQNFAKGGGQNPTYRSSHSYALSLDDLGARMLLEHGVCCPGETRTGGFRVEVYGPPPKRYALTFSIRQRGEPAPPLPPGLSATETVGGGKIFFTTVPRTGRKTTGSPAAIVNHSDEFLLPDLSTDEKHTQVRFTKAKYVKTSRGRAISLTGTAVSQSGNADIHNVRGDSRIFVYVFDAVNDEDDLLQWACDRCGEEDAQAVHRYVHGPRNRLTVRVGVVRRIND